MSQALASARNRRAPGAQPPTPSVVPQSPSTPVGAGLTLPQVITLVDKRLVVLESFMNDSQSKRGDTTMKNAAPSNNVTAMLDEVNGRYDLLAEEIINLKNIVLNLQSYTMEVNKTLLEERVHILSDVVEDVPVKTA
jgi:hypothetical protein